MRRTPGTAVKLQVYVGRGVVVVSPPLLRGHDGLMVLGNRGHHVSRAGAESGFVSASSDYARYCVSPVEKRAEFGRWSVDGMDTGVGDDSSERGARLTRMEDSNRLGRQRADVSGGWPAQFSERMVFSPLQSRVWATETGSTGRVSSRFCPVLR